MTESQVKQMQEMQEAIARLTESNNNLVQNQQLAMLAIQELAESKEAREQSAKGEAMKLKDFDFRIWDNGQKYAGDVVKKYMGLSGFSDDAEVELWSGFYDSKGVKIYESDIVQDSQGNTLVVSDSVIAIIKKIDVEVIGNIHENAELRGQNE